VSHPEHHSEPGHGWAAHRAEAWQDRYRIGAALCTGLLITGVLAAFAPRSYTADAALMLRLGREYLYTPEVGDAAGRTPLAYDREQTIQSETRILLSRDVLEAALDTLGVARIYPDLAKSPAQRGQAVLSLSKALDAELLKGSNLMQVQFKHRDPEVAAQTLSAVIDAYLQKRQRVFAGQGIKSSAADFSARQARLQQAETALSAFKQAHGIRAFAEEQSLLLAQRNALELKASDVALALAQSGGRAAALRQRLPQVPAEVTLANETRSGEATESTLKLLMDLKLKERDLSAKFADSEPPVTDVRQDIALATAHLQTLRANPPRTVRTGRSPVRDAAETDFEHTLADQSQSRAGRESITAQLARIDKRLAELAAHEHEWTTLERERRLAEADYEAAAKRLRDEQTMADLDRQRQSNVSMVQAPKVPLEGKSARMAIVAVGGVLSVAAALFAAFLSSLARQRKAQAGPGTVSRS